MFEKSEQINYSKRQLQILDVCINLIAEGGIQNLTTKHIAEKVGVSEPALYRHFQSKQDILCSILDDFKTKANNEIININNNKQLSSDKIKSLFLTRIKTFYNKPELSKVIFSEEIFQNEIILSQKVMEIMQLHQKAFSIFIKKAQENNEINTKISSENLCIFIMGGLRLLVTRWRLSGFSFDLKEKAEDLWNSIEILIKE